MKKTALYMAIAFTTSHAYAADFIDQNKTYDNQRVDFTLNEGDNFLITQNNNNYGINIYHGFDPSPVPSTSININGTMQSDSRAGLIYIKNNDREDRTHYFEINVGKNGSIINTHDAMQQNGNIFGAAIQAQGEGATNLKVKNEGTISAIYPYTIQLEQTSIRNYSYQNTAFTIENSGVIENTYSDGAVGSYAIGVRGAKTVNIYNTGKISSNTSAIDANFAIGDIKIHNEGEIIGGARVTADTIELINTATGRFNGWLYYWGPSYRQNDTTIHNYGTFENTSGDLLVKIASALNPAKFQVYNYAGGQITGIFSNDGEQLDLVNEGEWNIRSYIPYYGTLHFETFSQDFGAGSVTNSGNIFVQAKDGVNVYLNSAHKDLVTDAFKEAYKNNLTVAYQNITTGGGFHNLGGTIDLSTKSREAGDVLSVTGDFNVDGGRLVLDSILQTHDANNKLTNYADNLIINGNAQLVNNKTPMSLVVNKVERANYSQDNSLAEQAHKINLVTVTGQSDNQLFKQDNVITNGAYEYKLQKEGNNWVIANYTLNTQGSTTGGGSGGAGGSGGSAGSGATGILYNPYISNVHINQRSAMVMFNPSFAQRFAAQNMATRSSGALSSSGSSASAGNSSSASAQSLGGWHGRNLWVNTQFNFMQGDNFNGQHEVKSNTQQLQVGMDLWQTADFNAGVFAGYGMGDTKVTSKVSHSKTEGKIKGYMIGAYATYMPEDMGLYLDTWGYYAGFKNELKDKIANAQTAKYDSDGFALSAEVGYILPVLASDMGTLAITPHAQVTYSHLNTDAFNNNNTHFKKQKTNGVQTKLGARLTHEFSDVAIAPFIEANWVHNSMDDIAGVNGQTFKSDMGKNVGEAKMGLSGHINDNVSVWGNVSGQFGTDNYRDYGVQLGVGIRW